MMRRMSHGPTSYLAAMVLFAVCPLSAAELPWQSSDVGKTGTKGQHNWEGDRVVIRAGGKSVWGVADTLYYVYLPVRGDCEIIARLVEMAPKAAGNPKCTQYGVMIRETLDSETRQAGAMTRDNQIAWMHRTQIAGGGKHWTSGKVQLPQWLRVQRVGNVFTRYASTDGKDWRLLDQPVTVEMSEYAYIGLVACGGYYRRLEAGRAVFDSIRVRGAILPEEQEPQKLSQAYRSQRDASRLSPAQAQTLAHINDEVGRLAARRAEAFTASDTIDSKKLVAFGFDKPFVRQLKDVAALESKAPLLDGICVKPDQHYYEYPFNITRWDETEFIDQYETLRDARFTSFQHNFVWTTHASQLDWYDDQQWNNVMHNWNIVGKMITLGRLRGVAFDPETYFDAHPWSYYDAVHRDRYSFLEYERKVEQRGEEWIRMMQETSPNLTVLSLFFPYDWEKLLHDNLSPDEEEALGQRMYYGLLRGFLRGVLRGMDGDSVLINGNEHSYYYVRPEQYTYRLRVMRHHAHKLFGMDLREKYERHVRCGFSFYPEKYYGTYGNSAISQVPPELQAKWLEQNVYWALRTTDEYVWEYTESCKNWWDQRFPPHYVQALEAARRKVAAGEPLGFVYSDLYREHTQRNPSQEPPAEEVASRPARVALAIGDDLLVNGDWEDGVSGWHELQGDARITSATKHNLSGTKSLQARTNKGASAVQDVSDRVAPGGVYRLRFNGKVEHVGMHLQVTIQSRDAANQMIESPDLRVVSQQFRSYTLEAIIPESAVTTKVIVWREDPGEEGGLGYIDDISLVRLR